MRRPWSLVIGVILLAILWWRSGSEPPRPVAPPGMVVVERTVDGDTLVLEGGERIRLIGVDTPETKRPNFPIEKFGPEAAEFTRDMVEGKAVRLEFDREEKDRYGRTLAYVYVGPRLLNEELIRAGLSPAETKYPFRRDMKDRFRAAESEARRKRAGLWSVAP